MILYLLNTASGLKPLYDDDFEEKKKLKIGESYRATIVHPRNIQFHKKAMVLFKIGCDNSKTVDMPFDSYRKYATIKAGFANVYKTPKGVFVEAQSLSFDSMDEAKFQDVYSRVLDFVIKDTQADEKLFMEQLINFI